MGLRAFVQSAFSRTPVCPGCAYGVGELPRCPECGRANDPSLSGVAHRRVRRTAAWAFPLLPLPSALWAVAVAMDRTDLFGLPGSTPWGLAWFAGVLLAPFTYAPTFWLYAFHQGKKPRWNFVVAACIFAALANGFAAVAVPLVLYSIKYR